MSFAVSLTPKKSDSRVSSSQVDYQGSSPELVKYLRDTINKDKQDAVSHHAELSDKHYVAMKRVESLNIVVKQKDATIGEKNGRINELETSLADSLQKETNLKAQLNTKTDDFDKQLARNSTIERELKAQEALTKKIEGELIAARTALAAAEKILKGDFPTLVQLISERKQMNDAIDNRLLKMAGLACLTGAVMNFFCPAPISFKIAGAQYSYMLLDERWENVVRQRDSHDLEIKKIKERHPQLTTVASIESITSLILKSGNTAGKAPIKS